MTDGCTDTHIAPREHTNPQTHHPAPQMSGRPKDTHARTQVRPRATRTPRARTSAGPSAAGSGKVAALTQLVYLLICINERLYPTPPASGCPGCRICPRHGTLTRTSTQGSSDAAGGGRHYEVRGSERKGCVVSGPGRGLAEGNIGVS